jgi:hypothetical protein
LAATGWRAVRRFVVRLFFPVFCRPSVFFCRDLFAHRCVSVFVCAVSCCLQAVNIRRHLEKNRKDTDSKFRLILVESRIHRLARYYKVKKALPAVWKYESATASALVA